MQINKGRFEACDITAAGERRITKLLAAYVPSSYIPRPTRNISSAFVGHSVYLPRKMDVLFCTVHSCVAQLHCSAAACVKLRILESAEAEHVREGFGRK